MTSDETGDDDENLASLFAPPGGWQVRLLDLSGANAHEDDVIEVVKGFATVIDANAFARAYVRDSIELCRAPGMTADDVLAAWSAFGEDAETIDAGEAGWTSTAERAQFAATPAGPIERDWRELDPRRPPEGAEDGSDEAEGTDGDADGDGDDGGGMRA